MATVELYFKSVTGSGSSAGSGADIDFGAVPTSHAYILYRNDDGSISGYSRGGPESRRTLSPDGPGVFGYVVTDHGEYNPGTLDYKALNLTNPGFVLFQGSEAQVNAIRDGDYATLDQIQNEHLQYSFSLANSNSVIGTVLEKDGFVVPQAAAKKKRAFGKTSTSFLEQEIILVPRNKLQRGERQKLSSLSGGLRDERSSHLNSCSSSARPTFRHLNHRRFERSGEQPVRLCFRSELLTQRRLHA